jgi:4'-phosphopantetheinyl transferase
MRRYTDSNGWLSTPTRLEISSTAIDVWRCRLDLTADEVEELGRCLSEQERARAERFRFADKRSQFVTTRARLRQCLALATGTPAGEIEIHVGASGKPFLAGKTRSSEIQFNVSHTDALALIAITRGQAIGIDVESLGRSVNSRLAEDYFSARERDAIASLPSAQVPASFFACWTRKEAVLKATGTGIAHGLDSFDVATDPEIAHCRTQLQSEDGSADTWYLETLPCGAGYAAALAYQKHPVEIRFWC